MMTAKKANKTGPRADIDWARIRSFYETGVFTDVELAKKFGVNKSSIIRQAKGDGWGRGNTADRVAVATQTELVKKRGQKTLTDEAVREAAMTNVELIRGHRKLVASGREIVGVLLKQLTDFVQDRPDLEEQIMEATLDDQELRRRERMLKAVSLHGQAETLKVLSIAAINLVKLEREAFGLTATGVAPDDPDKKPVSEITKEMAHDSYRAMLAG